MDFACPLESKSITCSQLGLETVSGCLPTVFQKVFDQKPTVNKNRTFCLSIEDDNYSPSDTVKLEVDSSEFLRVTVSDDLKVDQITSDVLGSSAPINAVDKFILCYKSSGIHNKWPEEYELIYGRDKPKVNTKFYEKILGLMPQLKEVKLDIPSCFKENTSMKVTCETKHPLVSKVKLQATEDGQYQSMLNWCILAFPNLKWLNIYRSSGIWNESIGQFQVNLPKYTLEKLIIDMTPVRKKTIKHLEKQNSGENFFVLEVESLVDDKSQLYKIPMDLSSSSSLREGDLKDSILGEDYLRVSIIIKSIQNLELLMAKSDDKYSSLLYSSDFKRIILQCK